MYDIRRFFSSLMALFVFGAIYFCIFVMNIVTRRRPDKETNSW